MNSLLIFVCLLVFHFVVCVTAMLVFDCNLRNAELVNEKKLDGNRAAYSNDKSEIIVPISQSIHRGHANPLILWYFLFGIIGIFVGLLVKIKDAVWN
jgi:uncharacterized membrane protein